MANEKILVVDDDTNICELLRLYLTKEGYQVTTANDGEEGLEKFNRLIKFFSFQRILLFKKHNALTYHCRCVRHDALDPCVVWINGRVQHIVEGVENPTCGDGEQNLFLEGCSKFRNYRLKLVWLAGCDERVAL